MYNNHYVNVKKIMDSYIPCKNKSTPSSKSNIRSKGFPLCFCHFPISLSENDMGLWLLVNCFLLVFE